MVTAWPASSPTKANNFETPNAAPLISLEASIPDKYVSVSEMAIKAVVSPKFRSIIRNTASGSAAAPEKGQIRRILRILDLHFSYTAG
ncbi:hypothetical protein CCYS_09925 [Corynebacterium cystitidis DSM 20524]|uniref:Uncharacterized protein n=1 Tax=Corynebacterium cystitidis DSM 20524 TaxID=1121357 RepID=A0A1H9VMR9_9CORY|nr:hypothetical protein CCYS_09925 [Corynebacterium cystitidis DSM 20524]SES22902.1 hypothetical protein SAMN05661109_02304 [Corynebacterium cystitidis DSM 20524]SNV69308.1 Uncharacterised protein [Corynebacterium cystitidis]